MAGDVRNTCRFRLLRVVGRTCFRRTDEWMQWTHEWMLSTEILGHFGESEWLLSWKLARNSFIGVVYGVRGVADRRSENQVRPHGRTATCS